jgi:tetratricopeptide (TPR) repeat protein
LAFLYHNQGKYNEAELLYLRSLYIRENQLGEDHPDVAYSLNGLAAFYYSQGKYDDAETLCQRALQIFEQTLGIAHPNTIIVRGNYAQCLKEWVVSRKQTFPI